MRDGGVRRAGATHTARGGGLVGVGLGLELEVGLGLESGLGLGLKEAR